MLDAPVADPAVLAFVVIPLILVALLGWGLWTASDREADRRRGRRQAAMAMAAALAWMAVTWAAAESGWLRRWDAVPPPFALLAGSIVVLSSTLAFGPWGRQLARGVPLWALVAAQSFRLPLEIAMHAMYERGVMPEQMSYSGRNFDIVTGATAVVVAWLVRSGRGGVRLVAIWNLAGLGLLINIVAVALLSTPAVRYFGDDRLNTFVTYTPFVWLPAVLVTAALAGHLVIWRASSPAR